MMLFLSAFSLTAQVVIQRCDVVTGWEGDHAFSIDMSDKKEGRGSIMIEAQTGDFTWFAKAFAQTQPGG